MFLAFLMFLQAYEGNIRDAVGPFVPIRSFSMRLRRSDALKGQYASQNHQKCQKHQKARA